MSTNTRVLRNVSQFTVTPPNVNAFNVVSVMEVRLTDATGELKSGSDNDAAYKKFSNPFEFTGTLMTEDPIEAQKCKGYGNCNVLIVAVDINGGANVNCACTGVRFGQAGVDMAYGQQGRPSMEMSGGGITWT